ncbi:MAG: four helix bundle protein, partial [Bacteroidales bacterium]|nr:four helix bundle protein [Bacteroidales bacterium]
KFPKDELYSLSTQIRKSSRSVCSNIGEGYRKRLYKAQSSDCRLTTEDCRLKNAKYIEIPIQLN